MRGNYIIQEAVTVIKIICDKRTNESFTDLARDILSNTPDVIM